MLLFHQNNRVSFFKKRVEEPKHVGCPSSVTCPLKQSQVSTVSEQGAVTVATGSETPKL